MESWLDDDVESSNLALDRLDTAAATECDGSLVWTSGNAKAGIDAYTACGLVQSDSIKQAGAYTEHGDDAGLLTQIKCPFDNSDMFSLPAQVAKCVERGKNMFISNSCEEYRDDAPYRMVELSDGFAFELYFTDPDYSEDPYDPEGNNPVSVDNGEKDLLEGDGRQAFDWELAVAMLKIFGPVRDK